MVTTATRTRKRTTTRKGRPTTKQRKKVPQKRVRKVLSKEERLRLIAITAYYKAEKRGFAPGNEVADWLEAEKEIDLQLL